MLAEKLKEFIKGEVVSDDATLKKFSRDASLFEVKPEVVVYPKDVVDIKNLVKFASASKKKDPSISITPRSGGTDMTGGPLNESIIIDLTKNFNRIKEVGKDYAIVEPGVFYRDFEKETLKRGLLLPSYPASKDICTVGGMVANNSGGEKTLAYGKTEDYVAELKIILSDGNEYVVKPLNSKELEQKTRQRNFEGRFYRSILNIVEDNKDLLDSAKPKVSKNSSGYFLWNVWDPSRSLRAGGPKGTLDLNKLIVGSQGTLGIITEIKFKLVKVKKYDRLVAVFLKNNDIKRLPEIINTVLKHNPENFESYDDQTLKLAIRYFPEIARIMKAKNAIKLVFQFFPEFLMGIRTFGLPKLVLLINFAGDDNEAINGELRSLSNELNKLGLIHRITKDDEEEKKYWTIRRESFNLLRHHLHGKRTAPFIDDIIVRPEYLPEFLPELNSILKQYDIFYTIAGHMGDGNFHIIPIMNLAEERYRKIIIELSDKVYDLVIRFKGSISAEHNDGIIRTPYLEKMYGKKVYALFKKVKDIFDPENIFNPGKKVGSDFKYLRDHIIKTN